MNGTRQVTAGLGGEDAGNRLRICLVAFHALPAIDPSLPRPVGGTETRAWTFARGLAQLGDCDVSFVVQADQPRDPFRRDGVEVLPRRDLLYSLYESVGQCVEKSRRFPGLRLRAWSWSLLWQIPVLAACRFCGDSRGNWQRPDPYYANLPVDVFCTFGVQGNSARVIASAHAADRKVVLMLGSDGDLDERYRPDSDYIGPYGDEAPICYEILQRADAIVAQTPHQQQMLRDRFGRESTVIENPIDLPAWNQRRRATVPEHITGGLERYALWVGRAESIHKRPELLLEVARLCPQVDFLMVLNPRNRGVEQHVRSTCPPNVRIVSRVPSDVMAAVFARAAVFVSTSALEGFPNVFLQAAASGVPIVSLVVGREFLEASGGGSWTAGDLEQAAMQIRSFWADPAAATNPVLKSREYVELHHALATQTSRLLDVLQATSALQ